MVFHLSKLSLSTDLTVFDKRLVQLAYLSILCFICPAICPVGLPEICQGLPYNITAPTFASNNDGDGLSGEQLLLLSEPLLAGCPETAILFLCGLLYPECPINATGYFLCQEACQMLTEECPSLAQLIDRNCSVFQSGVPQGDGTCLSGELPFLLNLNSFFTILPYIIIYHSLKVYRKSKHFNNICRKA